MRYLTLRVQAFGRFAEPFILPLARQGFVLIEGVNHDEPSAFNSNGAGKSMLFEAFTWALFGKMVRYGDARIGADEVCVHGLPADVAVDFETAQGQFTAHRVQRPGHPARLTLSVPGQSIDRTEAETQLRRILGFDYQTHRVALFLQGEGLLVGGEKFSEQMSVLESLLRFDVFSDAADVAGRRAKALIDTIRGMVDALDRQSMAVENARNTIHELETMDETAREHEVMAEVRRLRPAARSVKVLGAQQGEALLILQDYGVQHSNEVAKRDYALKRLAAMSKLERDEEVECPTCFASVTAESIERCRTEAQAEADQWTLALVPTTERLDRAQVATTLIETALRTARTAETEVRNLMRELQDIRARAARRLAVIQTQGARRVAAEFEIGRLTEEIAASRRELQHAQFWQHAFGTDLKAEVLGAAAPVLNEAARRYSDILMNGAFVPVFNPIRESRSENMVRVTGSVPSRKAGSSGEKRRIDIVRALSYRAAARWRLGEPVNVTVWDELLDPLDESGLRRAIAILQQDMDELESVFLITHNAALKAMFPGARTIRVERVNGRSRVLL